MKVPELKKENSRFNVLHTEWGDFVRVEEAQQLEKTLWFTRAKCADLAAEVYSYRKGAGFATNRLQYAEEMYMKQIKALKACEICRMRASGDAEAEKIMQETPLDEFIKTVEWRLKLCDRAKSCETD